MNNIPQNIVDMVQRLANKSESVWLRNNSALTLMDIRDYIDINVNKFNRETAVEIKKEQKRK